MTPRKSFRMLSCLMLAIPHKESNCVRYSFQPLVINPGTHSTGLVNLGAEKCKLFYGATVNLIRDCWVIIVYTRYKD